MIRQDIKSPVFAIDDMEFYFVKPRAKFMTVLKQFEDPDECANAMIKFMLRDNSTGKPLTDEEYDDFYMEELVVLAKELEKHMVNIGYDGDKIHKILNGDEAGTGPGTGTGTGSDTEKKG